VHPSIFTVVTEKSERGLEQPSFGHGLEIRRDIPLSVRGMNELCPVIAVDVGVGHTEESEVLTVYELTPVRAVHPHERRRIIGQDAKLVMTGLLE
jgi:hypothetical protein